jgi:hypothetical protein
VGTEAAFTADWEVAGAVAGEAAGEVAEEEVASIAVALLGSGLFPETDLVGAKLRMVNETTASKRTPINALVTCPILDPEPGDFFP